MHDDDATLAGSSFRLVKEAYDAYVACFTNPTMALLDLASRAQIAVAYLDRDTIEADRSLTDAEWEAIAYQLDWYDEHVSGVAGGDLNASFLDQVFAAAGVARHLDDDTATHGDSSNAAAV